MVVVGAVLLGLGLWLWLARSKVEISPEEARERIRQGKYDVIVDVRTPEEWARGHRSDAISIPIGEFVTEFPKKVSRRDDRILFVCKRGIRAPAAALMAQKKGYLNVQAVVGDHDGLV
jgi:hypothetical protein